MDVMDRTCTMHRNSKNAQNFNQNTRREETTWEDNIKIVLKEIGCGLDSAV
jgi:hypothetical protein